jgi:hypothetical protein
MWLLKSLGTKRSFNKENFKLLPTANIKHNTKTRKATLKMQRQKKEYFNV